MVGSLLLGIHRYNQNYRCRRPNQES